MSYAKLPATYCRIYSMTDAATKNAPCVECGKTIRIRRTADLQFPVAPKCRACKTANALHGLTKVDRESMTGICNACGPVKVYETKQWRQVKAGRKAYYGTACASASKASSAAKRVGTVNPAKLMFRSVLLSEQGSCCAICRVAVAAEDAAIDHDYGTGLVRAALCKNCNVGVGMFGDDPERMIAAAAYVREQAARTDARIAYRDYSAGRVA